LFDSPTPYVVNLMRQVAERRAELEDEDARDEWISLAKAVDGLRPSFEKPIDFDLTVRKIRVKAWRR
jgi:hypothetical protein